MKEEWPLEIKKRRVRIKRCVKVKPLSHVWFFASPWTIPWQAPLSMGFSRQKYWNVLPFPSPGDLPNPVIKPGSSALQADSSCGEQGLLFVGAQVLGAWASVAVCTGLVAPPHVESSRTRDWTCVPCIGRWIPIHCTTREVWHLIVLLVVFP